MGCNASKPPEAMDYKNVPRFNPNYPVPKPPDDTKEELCGHEDFVPIDNNAKSVPAKDKERYQTLLPRLLQGTNNDVQKVRAIYSYTGSINYNDPQVTQAKEGDTPTYYIKMIKEKKGDVPTFFTILCRRAGIPCVILDGLGKGKNYVPGMSEKDMRSKWNAVHVNDNWRPVHVEWGHQDNGGKNKDKKDDFYFLTDPERFVNSCFPDDYQWQLLADPLTKKEWLNLPNFRPAFYELHMQLVKPKSGLIRAVKGKAEVEISVPPNMMDKIRVGYGLQYKGAISKNDRDQNNTSREMDSNRATESSRGMESSLKDEGKVERPKSVPPRLERYVFLNRKPSRFNFTMTLPVAGKYLFEITGNHMEEEESSKHYGAAKTLLCQFRVLSENDPLDEDCEPYPDAPEFGWGPTPHCARLGITPITHLEGIIFINPKEKKDIKFRLSEDLDFRTSLSHNYLPLAQLKDMSSWRQPRDDEMIVTVEIPEEGLFGLKIEAARAGSEQFFEIANYLLRQHSRGGVSEKSKERKVRSKMLRAKLNYAIEHGPTEKALKDAMDMFDCYNVPDQGEMARAQERLEHYWTIKRELNFSCRRRNNGVLDKWIKAGHSSKFESELEEDIRQAEDMKEKLGKLHGYLHPIAKMKPKTIQEIRTYQHPKPVTKDVMTATYILLGERKEGLQDWTNIQVLMARTGKDGLQKRILDRRPEDVNEKDVEVADVILEPHNINEAREASAGTAAFYRWAKEFIHFSSSPDHSYHKEGVLDRDTYRETYGISVNRHHEHIEFERHKYDSPRVYTNTGRSPEGKQDTKAHQTEKPSHQDPMEQNEEPIAQHDLENSSAPKDTQYQNNSPRRIQSKVTPNEKKPEPSPAYNDPGLKRDKQTNKSSPKNSLDEKPIHRESDVSKPKPEQKDKLAENTGNQKQNPKKEKPTKVDKQIEDITEEHPNDEDVKHREATPERKDEVTSKKTIQKENDQLQQKPIIPAQQRDDNKKPVQERSRKDRERKPKKNNEVGEKKEDVPKQEENQQKGMDDRQKKEVEKLKPDRHEQDKKKNGEREMKNSEEKKKNKDDKEKEEYEENVKKEIEEKEKKEKEMIDKERQKMADREKAAKLKKEKEEKEKTDREEREKNKRGTKEKEKEIYQKEKEDRLWREKEEKERKDKEKQELEKDAQIKKEIDAKERQQKERQKREKEKQLKREKEEKEEKEKAERQKKDREKKEKVEKEEQDRKEKKENKTEMKEPDKRSKEEDKARNDKEDKQKKEKADRDKRDKEGKERKEKEKEEKEKKEKEEKERNDKEKQLKEKKEKDKREKLDKVNKEKAKQEKEKEEREKKDKEEKVKKENEAKQNKEKEDTERREKKNKERQQKEENDKREREEKQKSENKSEKEKDPYVPVRSHSYYFFDLY